MALTSDFKVTSRAQDKLARAGRAAATGATIQVILNSVRKRLSGSDVAMTLEDQAAMLHQYVAGWVPNPCWPIDWLVSNMRGWPLGRGMIVWGAEGSGKSALAHFAAGCFSRAGGIIDWLDFDQAFDPMYIKSYGVDPGRFILTDADTIEEGLDAIQAAIESVYGKTADRRNKKKEKTVSDADQVPMLITWDSVAAAAPRGLLEQDSSESRSVGLTALILSEQMKKLRVLTKRRKIMPILINEQRDVIGGMKSFSGPMTKMPHGHAIKFFSTTTLRASIGGQMTRATRGGRDIVLGTPIEFRAMKARFGVTGRRAKVYLSYAKHGKGGILVPESNYMFLSDMNLLSARGDKGVSIKDLKSVGSFAKAEFSDVLKSAGKKIRDHVKSVMCADTVSATFDEEDAE